MIKHVRCSVWFKSGLSVLLILLVFSNLAIGSERVMINHTHALLFTYVKENTRPSWRHFLNEAIPQNQFTVSGIVTDETGDPLIGVSVSAIGAKAETQTDLNGKYALEVPSGVKTLRFSYIGFQTQDVLLNDRKIINVQLMSADNQLNDVVVVGYGTQKKESVVGAISQIQGDILNKVGGVSTISESLQGLIPGLTAVNSNGKPGADASSLFIRGIATTNGSGSPYILVDGVERDLNQIDPNEIQSISILKDASATAIYGTRGANGVILVTTKRGTKGKPEFSFTSNFGFKTPTVNLKYADYIISQKLYNEAALNDGLYGNLIPESIINAWEQNINQAGPNNPYFPQINWWDEMIKKVGYQKNYNLNASGGSDFMKYFVSVGYLNDGDIYNTHPNPNFDPSFKLQRYNWRSNFDFNVTKTTTFSVDFSGNFRYRNQPAYRIDGGGENGYGQAEFFQKLYLAPRNLFPLTYPDGTIGESGAGNNNIYVALNDGGQRVYKYFQGYYDAQLNQKLDFITKGLSANGKISYTSGSAYQNSITDNIAGSDADLNVIRYYRQYDLTRPQIASDGSVSYPLINEIRYPNATVQDQPLSASGDQIYGYLRNLYYELSLNYSRKFGDHEVSALALFNRRAEISQGNTNQLGIGLFGEDFAGRITYGYKSRYLLEFDNAYTGSSKFAVGKKFGYFPSGAVGWIISEEPYFKRLLGKNVLDYLKVRYNYGLTGSDDVPSNLFLQSYGSGGNVRFGDTGVNMYGPLYREGPTANPDNTWERSIKQDLGIDFEFFNKLKGTVDLFKEDRNDILLRLNTVPTSFGNSAPFANVGRTKNHGFELGLNYNDKIADKINYAIRLNYNWSENRIVNKDDPRNQEDYLKAAGKSIGYQTKYIQGGYYNSLDDIFNTANSTSLGVSQDRLIPGDFLFYDYNGDGVINALDMVPMAYTSLPLQNYSLGLSLSYKNWGFNALLYATLNNYKNIDGQFLWDFNNGFVNGQPNITGRWTPSNMNAEKPALHISNTAHDQISSTYSYLSASYIRLKNAEISYRLQSTKLKNFGVKSLQFYANGNNLITFTKLDNRIDPETQGSKVYPIVRRFNLGLRANF
ncbi:TonB-dependent receptor [Pedobacter sp. SD-b]|uniref:TonB-dependent receptor n=1 Tax=Pedobacter segetis TaxID=2793069 RepID=A0ABS1BKV9_9SPHI|nr:TonB-dependent receptor [Pedobacter segetis]MBK0382854.1 TonB-dependent receptor [Pedobacter segetis]